jgi:hypothetical protein
VFTACNPPVVEPASVPPPPVVAAGPVCAPPPAVALALLTDAPCPWILVPDGVALALRSTEVGASRSLVVEPPGSCAGRCEFTGVGSALGPVLLATRGDTAGEVIEAAYVGASLGGGVVRFAPLWFGRAARGDSTELGPSHTLAPWVCGEVLVLAVEGRLPASDAEEPADGLVRAAGVYGLGDDELRRTDVSPPNLEECTRVPLELP